MQASPRYLWAVLHAQVREPSGVVRLEGLRPLGTVPPRIATVIDMKDHVRRSAVKAIGKVQGASRERARPGEDRTGPFHSALACRGSAAAHLAESACPPRPTMSYLRQARA